MGSDDQADCEGLFSCTCCGDCCKGYGGTYLSETDIVAISSYIGVSPQRLTACYTRKSGGRLLLAQGENGYCIFWDNVCTIHPVKPRMCRAWPFIPSILSDVQNWHIMAASCPGMSTNFPDSVIRRCVELELRRSGKR